MRRAKLKFCADSESELRIHLSFQIKILDLFQSHLYAHFPNFAYILKDYFIIYTSLFCRQLPDYLKHITDLIKFTGN